MKYCDKLVAKGIYKIPSRLGILKLYGPFVVYFFL